MYDENELSKILLVVIIVSSGEAAYIDIFLLPSLE